MGHRTNFNITLRSIYVDGEDLQKSMKIALSHTLFTDIDAIITHTPETVKGDFSKNLEY
ncbi:MAG: hypothetical protein ABI045_03530 [Flavobacteriales bacterium]